jgi:hypothetical protein
MARVKVHAVCMRPLNECDCAPDDDDEIGVDIDGLDSDEDAAA